MTSKKLVRVLTGFVGAALLASCGFVADPNKGSAKRANLETICPSAHLEMPAVASGIIGGEIASPNSWTARQTIMVVQTLGHSNIATCTGTLVAPNVVLTAAHCVSTGSTSATFVVFKVRPNAGTLNPQDPQQVAKVDAIRIHPHFHPNSGTEVGSCSVADASGRGDIALLHLRTAAPKSFSFAQLMSESFSWTDLDSIIVAGYGNTVGGTATEDQQGEVALRSTTVEPLRRSEVDQIRIRTSMSPSSFAHMFEVSANAENIWLKQLNGRGVCNGDSGGPSFILRNGKPYQIGVLSAVTGNGTSRCNGFGLTTNVQFYRTWLEQTFAELNGADSDRRLFR